MSYCQVCGSKTELLKPIRLNGTKQACEVCWSEASCHKAGDLAGRIESMLEFEGGPTPIGYLARGHVDVREFKHEMMAAFGIEIACGQVRHIYMRNVPVGPSMPGIFCRHQTKPGRGAYPVTYYDALAA